MRNNKYGAKKCQYNGIVFDSKKEMQRYQELLLMQRAGEIKDLELQKKYLLIPAQEDPDAPVTYYTRGEKKGQPKPRKILEAPCTYIADFVYYDVRKNETVVEDAKGMRLKEYKIKRKLMLYVHKIKIREV